MIVSGSDPMANFLIRNCSPSVKGDMLLRLFRSIVSAIQYLDSTLSNIVRVLRLDP